MTGANLRARIGLQFFAEGDGGAVDTTAESGVDAGAADDSGEFDGFLEALGVEDEGGDHTAPSAEMPEEPKPEDGGDHTDGEPADDAGGEKTAEEEPQDEGTEEPTEMLELKYLDNRFAVPKGAVDTIAQSLGVPAQTVGNLLQMGMGYESKNAREMSLLSRFAEASGVPLADYLGQMENQLTENMIAQEVEAIRGRYPGATEAALRDLAKGNVDKRNAETEQGRKAREAQAEQERARQQAMDTARPWLELKRARPEITGFDQLPKAAQDMVRQGVAPLVALLTAERDAAKTEAAEAAKKAAVQQKNTANKRKTTGSQQGAGADSYDPFLAGLFG